MPSTMLGTRGTNENDREPAPEELMISWEIQTGTEIIQTHITHCSNRDDFQRLWGKDVSLPKGNQGSLV